MASSSPNSRSILAFAAAALGGLLWAGCRNSAPPAPAAAAADPYMGSAACAQCHADISTRQAASPHARTLSPMNREWAAGKFAPTVRLRDPHGDFEYAVAERNGRFYQVLRSQGRETGAATVDYLVGSGHHGTSPLSFDGSQWRYLSLTYYGKHGWDFSPIVSEEPSDPAGKDRLGVPVSSADLQKCFRCHVTRLEFRGTALDEPRSELGVRCEACHGPGRAHVEAVRHKSADPAITNPRKWSTPSFMALCQQCHNETSTLEGTLMGIPTEPNSPKAVKYHVYGIEKSRCYIESKGAFRCTTCHDPHSGASAEPAFYEARCLSCHASGVKDRHPCPVNASTGCLGCHMPKVRVEKYTEFADHWIRARSPFASNRTRLSLR